MLFSTEKNEITAIQQKKIKIRLDFKKKKKKKKKGIMRTFFLMRAGALRQTIKLLWPYIRRILLQIGFTFYNVSLSDPFQHSSAFRLSPFELDQSFEFDF